jgi:chromosome segregation ATPase
MFRRASARARLSSGSLDPAFVSADPSLDLMIQARENLTAFKAYLEHDPSDSGRHYDIVAQTMSRACSQFTNRTAELEIKLAEARAGAMDIEAQERAILDKKRDYAADIDRLASEEERLRVELDFLLDAEKAMSDQIDSQKSIEETVSAVKAELRQIEDQNRLLADVLNNETRKTAALSQELAQLEAQVRAANKDFEVEIEQYQAKIKELAVVAKAAEEREVRAVEAKKKPSEPAPKQKTETFVIHDTVRISEEEMEHLAFMVRALGEDNERLGAELYSKMMDVDCLMQENKGLKQLLREMVESG